MNCGDTEERIGGKLMPAVDGTAQGPIFGCEARYLHQPEQVPTSGRDVHDAQNQSGREKDIEQPMRELFRQPQHAGVD